MKPSLRTSLAHESFATVIWCARFRRVPPRRCQLIQLIQSYASFLHSDSICLIASLKLGHTYGPSGGREAESGRRAWAGGAEQQKGCVVCVCTCRSNTRITMIIRMETNVLQLKFFPNLQVFALELRWTKQLRVPCRSISDNFFSRTFLLLLIVVIK